MKSLAKSVYYGALHNYVPPTLYTSIRFFNYHARIPRISSPRTFSEKVQHRKLYDHDVRLPLWADKVSAKNLVADRFGPEWIIPSLWIGRSPADIPWDDLPDSFVLKASHGSSMNYFVRNRREADRAAICKVANRWLQTDYGKIEREWAYSQIDPKLLIEPLLLVGTDVPIDYRFWMFHGKLAFIQVCTGRFVRHKSCLYDRNWVKQSFHLACYPLEESDLPRPESLERMIEAAEIIGKEFSFVRVDLYEINRQPLFGEATFYPGSGFIRFSPSELDEQLGALWDYPGSTQGRRSARPGSQLRGAAEPR